MNIVFDFKIFFQQKYGGPSRYFFNLFEYINKKNTNLNCAYIISPIYYNEYLKNSLFPELIIGKKLPKIKFTGGTFKMINKFLSNKYINRFKPNLIHTTDYEIYSEKKYPLIVTVHDLIPELYSQDFAKTRDYRPKKKILEISDQIICVSENTKKDLIKYYDVDQKKISVIYHGNSFINYTSFKSKQKFDFKFFLFIGSRKRYKNFFKLIKAFKICKEIYDSFKIVCFGGGKLLESEKKKLIENDVDLEKVIILNEDDQSLFELYKNAYALIYPSFYEGFGMPIVEAMSLGCPVISSNAGSLPEVFGDAALSFDPFSVEQLSQKIEQVVYGDQIRNNLINLGLKQSKKFSWEKCAEETLTIYNKII